MKRILIAALLALTSVAHAGDDALKGTQLRLVPRFGAPDGACLTLGNVCLWYDANTARFLMRNANGSDTQIGSGGGTVYYQTIKDSTNTSQAQETYLKFGSDFAISTSAPSTVVSLAVAPIPSSRTLTAGTGLSGGGDLSANRTFNIANTAVTPGSYSNTNITVNAQGQITAASNGTGGGGGGVSNIATTAPLSGGPITTTGTLSCPTCITGSPSVVGDILYSTSGGQAQTALADVSSGSYLRSGGVAGAPLWSTLKLPNTAATGDLLYGSSSNTVGAIADVATGQVLLSGGVGSAPAWGPLTSANISAALKSIWWSPVNYCNDLGTVAASGGNFAVGTGFYMEDANTQTGVKFLYPDTTSRSIKVSLWDDTGTRVATATNTYSTAGVKTVTWGSPVSMSGTHLHKIWYVTYWDTAAGSGSFVRVSGNTGTPTFPAMNGQSVQWKGSNVFGSGDAIPSSNSTDTYPIEPTFTVP